MQITLRPRAHRQASPPLLSGAGTLPLVPPSTHAIHRRLCRSVSSLSTTPRLAQMITEVERLGYGQWKEQSMSPAASPGRTTSVAEARPALAGAVQCISDTYLGCSCLASCVVWNPRGPSRQSLKLQEFHTFLDFAMLIYTQKDHWKVVS